MLLVASSAWADIYVSRDCANNGDGTSWTCAESPGGAGAFNDTPDPNGNCGASAYTWVRGTTYWFAGSDTEYRWSCMRNFSGTGTLTIKKATASTHGTDTGWQASYGTKQAILNGFQIRNGQDYAVLIDGQVGSGRSGYGFKFMADGGANTALLSFPASESHSNTTVQFAEMASRNTIADGCVAANNCLHFAVYIAQESAAASGYTIQNSYIHDIANPIQTGGVVSNLTVSGTIITRNDDTATYHTSAVAIVGRADTFTFKNNFVEDIEGTSIIAGLNGTTSSNWYIYNNVFYYTGNYASDGLPSGIKYTNSGTLTGLYVYSNTFVSKQNSIVAPVELGSGAAWDTVLIKNNLYYTANTGCTAQHTAAGTTVGYNSYYGFAHNAEADHVTGEESTFVDLAGANFRLIATSNAKDAGATLGSPYNTDILGTSRPQGAAWDIGAMEYVPPSIFIGSGGTITFGSGGTITLGN